MDDKMKDLVLRVGAASLTALGVIVVLIGYLGVRDESDIALQIPYLMSGGLGGLTLVGLGALCLIQWQMRQQAHLVAKLADDLDEWKEAAIADLRDFLASAVVEIDMDVSDEPVEVIRRQRTLSSVATGEGTGGQNGRRQPLRARR